MSVLALLLFFTDPSITGLSIDPASESVILDVNETLLASSIRVPLNETMRITRVSIDATGFGAEPYVRIAGRTYPLVQDADGLTGLVAGAFEEPSDPIDPDRVNAREDSGRSPTRISYADGPYDVDNDGTVGRDDAVDFISQDAACVVWSVVSESASLFCKGDDACCREQGFPDPVDDDASSLVLTRETADGSVGRVLARASDGSFSEPLSFDFTGTSETYREFSGCGEACSLDSVVRFIEIGTRSGRLDVRSVEISYVALGSRLVDETRIEYAPGRAGTGTAASSTAPSARVQAALADRLERGNRVRALIRNESGVHVRELRKAEFDEMVRSGAVTEATIDQPVSVFTSDALTITDVSSVQSEYGLSGDGVRVCIVDTGVDEGLFWREGADYEGWNVLDNTSDFQDDHGHGSQVAYPLVRSAPGAYYIAVKALDDSGVGYESDVLKALDECASRGADVISLSIGSGLYDGLCDANIVAERVNELASNGTLVVTAAGNEGGPLLKAPACASNATAVIASDDSDALWSGSSYLEGHAVLSAPGVDIETVDRFGDAATASGTSMSTPFVSGAAALVLENRTNLAAVELRDLLIGSGDVFNDSGFTYARLNTKNAIDGVITNSLSGLEAGIANDTNVSNGTVGTLISSCQSISSAGVYTLDQDVTTTTTCFTISVSHVELSCGGFQVEYGTGGAQNEEGVYINSGLDNITVSDCTFTHSSSAQDNLNGIFADGGSGSEITNLTIERINGTQYSGLGALIRLEYAPDAIVRDSNLTVASGASADFEHGMRNFFSDRTIVSGIVVNTSGTNPRGMAWEDSSGWRVENSTFSMDAPSENHQGLNYIRATNTTVKNVTFENVGTDVGFLLFNNVNDSKVIDVDTSGPGASIFHWYSSQNVNNYVYNSTFNTTGTGYASDIVFTNTALASNITLVNTTYSDAEYDGSSGTDDYQLYYGWYVDVFVEDVYDDPVSGATVNYTDGGTYSAANPSSSETGLATDGSGYSRDLVIYEYTENYTGTYYHNNYTFWASSGPDSSSNEKNVTENTQVNITFGTPISSCQTISSLGTYYLTSNLTALGTCIDITASSVTLVCFGYTINYADTSIGAGVNVSAGLSNITIEQCDFVQTSNPGSSYDNAAIRFDGSSGSEIDRIKIENTSYSIQGTHQAVVGDFAHNATMNDFTIVSSGTSAYTEGISPYGDYGGVGWVYNWTISNGSIEMVDGRAIYGRYLSDSTISDVNITITNSDSSVSRAILLFNSQNNVIERTNITLLGTSGNGIQMRGRNTVRNSLITHNGSSNAILMDGSGLNYNGAIVQDTVINFTGSGGTPNAIYFDGVSSTEEYLSFINVSHNKSTYGWEAGAEGGTVYVGWRLGARVNDTSGNLIDGALVAWESVGPSPAENLAPTGSGTTGADGWLRGGALYEYRENSSSKVFFQNHSVTASRAGYEDDSTHANMSTNQDVFLTISAIATDTPTISFVDPTPSDGTVTGNTNTTINVSMSMDRLYAFNFTWDGTTYSLYDDSLMLMYNLDNQSSLGENDTHVYDLTGRGNNGTVGTGVTYTASGRYGGAFEFDTTNNDGAIVAQSSNDFDFNSTTGYSVFLWFKKDSVCDSPDDTNEVMMSRFGTDHGVNTWWLGCRYNGGSNPNQFNLNFFPSGGTSASLTGGSAINDGQWHHGGWVWDPATSNVTLFLDGTAIASGEVSSFPNAFHSFNDLCIGTYDVSCDRYEYRGVIDEPRIYKRALSASEVEMQYWSNLRRYNETEWNFITTPQMPTNPKTYNYSASVTSYSIDTASTEERSITTANAISSCQTISSPGVYALTSNVSSTGTCFTISTSDVTLDCGGNTVTHATSTSGTGILINQALDNVTVENCKTIADVTGADSSSHGVHFDGSLGNEITNATIRDVNSTVLSTARALYGYYSPGIVIEDSYGETFITASSVVSAIETRYSPGAIVNRSIGVANGTAQYTTGIMIRDSNGSRAENLEAYSYGAYGPAFWLIGDTNDTVVRNSTFIRDGTTTDGATIWMRDVGNISLIDINFSTQTSGAWGIGLYTDALGDLHVYNSTIDAAGADVRSESTSAQLHLVNTTFSTTSWGSGDTSPLYRGWYVDAYVNDTIGSGVSSASIDYADGGSFGTNPTPSGTGLATDDSGFYRDLILYEYTEDDTGQTYYTNYTFDATATGYSSVTGEPWNLTDNVQLNFTISEIPVVENVTITSSSGTNTSSENLTVTFDVSDSDGLGPYNTTDWRVNGVSIAVVNMPFNVNVSSTATGAVDDLSSFNNDGTLAERGSTYVAPSWNSSCKIGGCYTFEGSVAAVADEEHINLGSSTDYDSDSFTFAFWIRPNGLTTAKRDSIILGRETFNTQGFRVGMDSVDGIEWWMDESGGTLDLRSGTLVPVGVWSHIALRYNGTHGSIFVNGTHANTTNGTYVVPTGDTLYLNGGIGGTAGSNSTIDEFLYFNRSLSDEQINAIYDTQNANASVDTIVSQETLGDENWSVAMTSSDTHSYSTSVLSENLTINDTSLDCQTISSPGTYTLTQDVSSTGSCFQITTSDVLLDCAGYTINYSQGSSGNAIYTPASSGYDNLTIRDCAIVQGSTNSGSDAISIRGDGADYSDSITIENTNITTFSHGSSSFRLDLLNNSVFNNLVLSVSADANVGDDFSTGMYLYGVDYTNYTNIDITVTADTSNGIRWHSVGSDNSRLENITINVSGSNGDGLSFFDGSHTNFQVLNATVTASSDAYVSQNQGIDNITFINSSLDGGNDVSVRNSVSGSNHYLINTVLTSDDINFQDGTDGLVHQGWYVDFYVNDTAGSPLSATINYTDSGTAPTFNPTPSDAGLTTAGDGFLRNEVLYEFTANATARYSHTNYTFNVSATSYNNLIDASRNFTSNTQLNFTLDNNLDCQTISSPGTYTLTSDVSSTGTCFTITSSDVTLDCSGYTINYTQSSAGNGILIESSNVTVNDCTIAQASDLGTTSEKDGAAIFATDASTPDLVLGNLTITTIGRESPGIKLNATTDSIIRNATISVQDISSYGIHLDLAHRSIVEDINITSIGNNAGGIIFSGTDDSNVSDSLINVERTAGFAVGVQFGSAAQNNIIANVTINATGETAYGARAVTGTNTPNTFYNSTISGDTSGIQNDASNSETLFVINTSINNASTSDGATTSIGWYVDLYVDNLSASPVSGATINYTDSGTASSLNPTSSANGLTTDGSGFYRDLILYEYSENSTSTYYHTNYTFNVSATSYNNLIDASRNFTSNTQLNFTLNNNFVCQVIDTPGTYTLGQNVTSTATCFTINADHVELDCAGYTIEYATSATGRGIDVGAQDNVTIRNCNIDTGGPSAEDGIDFEQATNSLVDNSNFTIDVAATGTLNGIYVRETNDTNLTNIRVDITGTENGGAIRGITAWRTSLDLRITNLTLVSTSTSTIEAFRTFSGPRVFMTNARFDVDTGYTLNLFTNPNDSVFRNLTIVSNDTADFAPLRFDGSGGNITFIDANVTSSAGYPLIASSTGTGKNVTFYNSTLTNEATVSTLRLTTSADKYFYFVNTTWNNETNMAAEASTANMTVGTAWYVDIYVNDTAGTPLAGAVINLSDGGSFTNNPSASASYTTGADGWVRDVIIYDSEIVYFETRNSYNNYTFNVTNSSYNPLLDQSRNLTDNTELVFTLNNFDPPNVTLLNPSDPWVTNSDPLFECRAESSSALVNVSLYTNASGWGQANTTTTSGTNSTVQLGTNGLAEGDYAWNCYACNADTCAFAPANSTITVDTTAPTLAYELPTPSDLDTVTDTFVFINVSSSDTHNHSTLLDWNGTLVLWSAFDEYNATHVFDRSVQGNNGTKTGDPELVEGYYGKAFRFNTTNSITIPNVLT